MHGMPRVRTKARANNTVYSSIGLVSQREIFILIKSNTPMFTSNGVTHLRVLLGKCNKGEKCLYIHDPDKIALCPK